MPILNLLKRFNAANPGTPHPVLAEEKAVKKSFLSGIAVLGYADGDLHPNEREHYFQAAEAFRIKREEAEKILDLAAKPNDALLRDIRGNLENSKFKFYFIVDLHIMAHQDNHVKPVEAQVLEQFSTMLQIDQEDVTFLKELADAVMMRDASARDEWTQRFFTEANNRGNAPSPEEFTHYTDDANF